MLQQYRLTMGTSDAVQQILAVVTANQFIQPQQQPDGKAGCVDADHNLFIKPQEVILDDPLPRRYNCISPLTVCTSPWILAPADFPSNNRHDADEFRKPATWPATPWLSSSLARIIWLMRVAAVTILRTSPA